MATIGFGTGQLSNPTPSNLARGLDITTGVSAALITWIGTAAFIPPVLSTILQSILGLVCTLAMVIKPFFGVVTIKKDVPISDVTSMET